MGRESAVLINVAEAGLGRVGTGSVEACGGVGRRLSLGGRRILVGDDNGGESCFPYPISLRLDEDTGAHPAWRYPLFGREVGLRAPNGRSSSSLSLSLDSDSESLTVRVRAGWVPNLPGVVVDELMWEEREVLTPNSLTAERDLLPRDAAYAVREPRSTDVPRAGPGLESG